MTTKDPTRVKKLATAQSAVQIARESLNDIDLRKCSREMRTAVKEARGAADDLGTLIHQSFLTDAHEAAGTAS